MRAVSRCLLVAVVTAAGAAPQQSPTIVKFRGEVSRGKTFERRIGPDFFFRLVPEPGGADWDITVGHKAHCETDFVAVASPPYRGPNDRMIMAWHFRNADNSGPNVPGPKYVRPGKVRGFSFVFNHEDEQKLSDAIEKLLHSYSYTKQQVDEAQKATVPVGDGKLTILDLKLGNLKAGEDACIEYMKFEVELDLRPHVFGRER